MASDERVSHRYYARVLIKFVDGHVYVPKGPENSSPCKLSHQYQLPITLLHQVRGTMVRFAAFPYVRTSWLVLVAGWCYELACPTSVACRWGVCARM